VRSDDWMTSAVCEAAHAIYEAIYQERMSMRLGEDTKLYFMYSLPGQQLYLVTDLLDVLLTTRVNDHVQFDHLRTVHFRAPDNNGLPVLSLHFAKYVPQDTTPVCRSLLQFGTSPNGYNFMTYLYCNQQLDHANVLQRANSIMQTLNLYPAPLLLQTAPTSIEYTSTAHKDFSFLSATEEEYGVVLLRDKQYMEIHSNRPSIRYTLKYTITQEMRAGLVRS
jgi:hypothetical protein